MGGIRIPVEGLVHAGVEPVFAFYLDNQVDEKLQVRGVSSEHNMGGFEYTNWAGTRYGQINMVGLKLNVAEM